MTKLLRGLGRAAFGAFVLSASAAVAQNYPSQPGSNPVCVRLESQLAMIDRGAGESARSDQIKRLDDAVARQQADLDRTVAQARRSGCEGQGFFALFSGLSPQCGPITSQIQQMRGNLDRMMSDLERLKSGSGDQDVQRRSVIGQLAQNNCGAQYTAAANTSGPRGFFEALFGGGTIVSPGGDGAPSGTYRTVCVRTCDGFYFPVSYSTVPNRFSEDQRTCQRLCPATQVMLFSYRNPGEGMEQATSISGQPYTELPNAFRYRREVAAACSCRRPGQSWAEALRSADDGSTIERGDIIVTDQKSKALSQVPQPGGKPPVGAGPAAPDATSSTPASDAPDSDPAKRTVRTVGPPFLSRR